MTAAQKQKEKDAEEAKAAKKAADDAEAQKVAEVAEAKKAAEEAEAKEASEKAKAEKEAKKAAAKTPAPKNISVLDEAIVKLMTEHAAQFVKDNADDVSVLGEDLVRRILTTQVLAMMPAIPNLPDDASLQMRVGLETILTTRRATAAAVAKAERENATRINRLRGNASITAGKIIGGIGSLVGGILVKTLLGV